MSALTIEQRYNIAESYDWNYDHAPGDPPRGLSVPAVPGSWTFCGLPVASPLGIPAGPLLNSRWILYYAALGFDVLTYKTVRSRYRASYPPPNLLPVEGRALSGDGAELRAAAAAHRDIHSWAISFGMPSKDPAEWRADVERARRGLAPRQLLSVSVVASPEENWTMNMLASDFAQCAVWAADAGADVVEANLSCPNVCTKEADLYLAPDAAAEIASAIRARLPRHVPLALKIGLFPDEERAAALARAVAPFAAALATTNSISASVRDHFGGLKRGIGGAVTTRRCNEELAMLARHTSLKLIGVGGLMTAQDVRDRLAAGAEHVHLATAPMLMPGIGLSIRKDLA